MARTEFELRSRPHKAAVLLPWEASPRQCLHAVSFLSKLWGGRYCPLIPVKAEGEDQLAKVWLREHRPDAVFGLGVDHAKWSDISQDLCQAYRYAPLTEDTAGTLRESRLDLIPASCIYRQVMEDSPVIEEAKSNVVLVETDESCDLAAHVAATFGIDEEDVIGALEEAFKAWVRPFHGQVNMAEYVRVCDSMSSRLSLLDLASYRMDRHIQGSMFPSPSTVIVADALGADLALFWNMRMSLGAVSSETFLLFPTAGIDDDDAVAALAAWLARSAKHADYCQVRSLSADEATLKRLARRLRPRVARRGLKHVDVYWGEMHVPVVLAYEQQAHVPVEANGQLIQCVAPMPRFHEFLKRRHTWVVDLVRDTGTRRRPLELLPPPNATVPHVLNAPFPPRLIVKRVYDVRHGPEAISVRCSKASGNVRWCAPTDAELLESILMGAGFATRADEKRQKYEAAMAIFGGLLETARAFPGVSGLMLAALADQSLTWGELLGVARAGKKTRPEGPKSHRMDLIKNRVARRIGEERFKRYLAEQHPLSEQAPDVLSYWEKRGVISREAMLPPCPSCGHPSRLVRLDLGRAALCPECEATSRLPDRIELRYRLSPVVARAMDQGIGPVVLTGRFLRQLTSEGFMWLPGVKGEYRGEQADVDIIACCDGHLALAECKTLAEASPESGTWGHVIDQMSELVELARACKAELIFLAFMGTACAPEVEEFARLNSSEDLRIHILTGPELERGWRVRPRKAGQKGSGAPMTVHRFLARHTELRPGSSPRKGKRHRHL